MKVIGTVNKLTVENAKKIIELARPDFKIGALFVNNGLWHAVHDDGEDSTRLICVQIRPDKSVVGINPFSVADVDGFFDALNNKAFDADGKPLGTQLKRERKTGLLPSDEYEKELMVKRLINGML